MLDFRTMKTTFPAVDQIPRRWLLVDAKDQILGRLASRVAILLRGKHKVAYTPFLDSGDCVIVINAKHVKLTGQKLTQKVLKRYTGYPGGLRQRTVEEILSKHPERIIHHAVKGMMPDGPLARHLLGKLKVYPGAEHPHRAQQPEPWSMERRHAKS